VCFKTSITANRRRILQQGYRTQKVTMTASPIPRHIIMQKFAAILVIILSLTGCAREEESPWTRLKAAAPHLTASTNTPDAAVKSWWQARDARANFGAKVCNEMRELYDPVDRTLLSLAAAKITNDIADPERCAPTVYSRDISKVDIQSDTRAIVQAQVRNATPPSKGYVLDEDDKRDKDRGIRMQYLLERNDANQAWKIAQIYSDERYCSHPVVDGWCPVYEGPAGSSNAHVWAFSQ